MLRLPHRGTCNAYSVAHEGMLARRARSLRMGQRRCAAARGAAAASPALKAAVGAASLALLSSPPQWSIAE